MSPQLPEGTELLDIDWAVGGSKFAISAQHKDHIGLWLGSLRGDLIKAEGVSLNPTFGGAVLWMPDQRLLLVKSLASDTPPSSPAEVGAEDDQYEAIFEHYATSQLLLVDPETGEQREIGSPGIYSGFAVSPDSKWLLVERLVPPWDHGLDWRLHAHDIEIWRSGGETFKRIAAVPLSPNPVKGGVPKGPRQVEWSPSRPASLIWTEALDGGNPKTEADHRDRLMLLDAPFSEPPKPIFKAEHRIEKWYWSADGNLVMLRQWEADRDWQHNWLMVVESGTSAPWFGASASDPVRPLLQPMESGHQVLRQSGEGIFFSQSGEWETGHNSTLCLRSIRTGRVHRPTKPLEEISSKTTAPPLQRHGVAKDRPSKAPNDSTSRNPPKHTKPERAPKHAPEEGSHVFRVRIPRDEWMRYYNGEANKVFVRTGTGLMVSIPAHHFRPFTTFTGLQGVFVMELGKGRKLLSLNRLG
jgi:hypothetical protein